MRMLTFRTQTQPVTETDLRPQNWVLNSSITVGLLVLIALAAAQLYQMFVVRLDTLKTDAETILQLERQRQPADAPLLTTLSLDGQQLLYDTTDKTFYCSLTESQQNSFNPVVRFEGAQSKVQLCFLDDSLTADRLRNNQPMTVLAYTDTTYTLYHLALTTLPLVRVTLDDPIADADKPIGDQTIAGQFTLYDNRSSVSGTNRLFTSSLTIHERGATSKDYPKNSYKLHLKNDSDVSRNVKDPLLGMRKSDDWILYAGYNDPDKVRNAFSSNLWYSMGSKDNALDLNCGVQARMVELFIGDRYWGIYSLMEPLDDKTVELQGNADPLQSEYLYRSLENIPYKPGMFSKAAKEQTVANYKLCWPDDKLDTVLKWQPLDNFEKLLSSDDQTFLQGYPNAIDTNNSIDFWLFLQITAAADNDGKNLFYIAKRSEDRSVMLFAPWDLDQTWGISWTNILPLRTGMDVERFMLNAPPVATGFTRLLQLEHGGTLVRQIQQRYAQLRSGILSDQSLQDQLRGYEEDVYASGAQARDSARWPLAAHNQDMSNLDLFVKMRMQTMDGIIAKLPDTYK